MKSKITKIGGCGDDGANVKKEVEERREGKNYQLVHLLDYLKTRATLPPRAPQVTFTGDHRARKFMQLDLSFTSWFFGLLFLILFLVMPLTVVALRNRKAFRCFQSSYKRSVSLD